MNGGDLAGEATGPALWGDVGQASAEGFGPPVGRGLGPDCRVASTACATSPGLTLRTPGANCEGRGWALCGEGEARLASGEKCGGAYPGELCGDGPIGSVALRGGPPGPGIEEDGLGAAAWCCPSLVESGAGYCWGAVRRGGEPEGWNCLAVGEYVAA